MPKSLSKSFANNFLGHSPTWYKWTIVSFLLLNPIILAVFGPYVTGWLLVAEFIFTLALALSCYPLLPGGLLAMEALLLGLTTPDALYHEVAANFPVIMLLMFMVAGIHFMQDLLLLTFTRILLGIRTKWLLALMFSLVAALLSAFLDALTVTAVIITVSVGFYKVYHRVASNQEQHDAGTDEHLTAVHREELEQFRAFLRSLLMHAAVGTALGGVCTLVGEPQNLLIAKVAGWDFKEFFLVMSPVSMPTLLAGLITCVILEKLAIFGYGTTLPDGVRSTLEEHDLKARQLIKSPQKAKLIVQALVAVFLIFALAFHIAEVGLVGLAVIVLITAFNGISDEHQIGKAFTEALPFTSLLVVFFAVVAVIHEQHLFAPITQWVLNQPLDMQPSFFFIANGLLSMISDNVFVATVYINEVKTALDAGKITREHFDLLAVAINTGTNLPSVATPNGQAAFLFLLTSAIAPLVRLSYGRMVIMALPYTIVMSAVALYAVANWI